MSAFPARVLLATRSAGKLRELRPILADAGIEAVSLDDIGIAPSAAEDGLEEHNTFEANALAKARYFNRISLFPTMADDSGLCVDALHGAPGVWSKRYAGRSDLSGQELDDANNARLLLDLSGQDDLSASYACAAAFVDGDDEVVRMGFTAGRIVDAPRGTNGFGYDPYFFSDELGVTFGEASIEKKQRVSHRGRAFSALVSALRERGESL